MQAGNASWCQVVHRCTSLPLAVKHTVRQFSSSMTRQIATTLVHDWRPKGLWAKSYATNKEHRRETDWVQASEDATPTTLYAANGRLIPLSANSPTGSTFTAFSTFVSTRGLIKICPGFASSQSREATLDTVPIAA